MRSRATLKEGTFRVFVMIFQRLSKLGFRKSRLFDKLYWFVFMHLSPGNMMTLKMGGFSMYVDTRDLFVSSLLIRDSSYEEFETGLFRSVVRPGVVVVDIGAQIGYYTMLASKLCGADGRIYAFEPNQENYQTLLSNVKLNGFTNVFPMRAAVSDKSGVMRLFLDSFNLGKHSLSLQNVIAIDTLGGAYDVETTSLDDFVRDRRVSKIDVVKIDAEGAEGLIVSGGRRTLEEQNIILFVETWPFGQRNLGTDPLQMFETLKAMGYGCWRIDERRNRLEVADPVSLCATTRPRESFNVVFAKGPLVWHG